MADVAKKRSPWKLIAMVVAVAALASFGMIVSEAVKVLKPYFYTPAWKVSYEEARRLMDTDPDAAEKLMKETIESMKSADMGERADLHYHFGTILFDLRKFDEAKAQFAECERLGKTAGEGFIAEGLLRQDWCDHWAFLDNGPLPTVDKSLRALHMKRTHFGQGAETAPIYFQLGHLYTDRKEFDKAKENFDKAIEVWAKMNDSEDVADTYVALSRMSDAQKDESQARQYLVKAFSEGLSDEDFNSAIDQPFVEAMLPGKTNVERINLENKAEQLLEQKKFGELDALADSLRKSQAAWADGYWKLDSVYGGIDFYRHSGSQRQFEQRIDLCRQWMKANPKSITAPVALSKLLSSYAWKARGGGWANTVTERGWKLMQERLEESESVLRAAHKLPQDCPGWYSAMQRVALGLSWDDAEYDELVDDCIKKYPHYHLVYMNKGYRVLPRWFGKEGDTEKWAEQAADKIGGKEGDELYAQIAWYLSDVHIEKPFFEEYSNFDWDRIKRGFEELKKEYPESRGLYLTYAKLAAAAKDKTVFPTLFAVRKQ